MKFSPHGYQQRAIDFILEHDAAGLFLDMGLGKTVITLTAIQELIYERFETARVLIIAPLSVAEDTWTREADKWEHLNGLKISKVLGPAKDRIAGLHADADIYIINRENVVWLTNYLREQKKQWPFDMLVIDELSSFKSNSAKRFKALRNVLPMVDRVVGLTGTPASNGLMDLWAEMYLLDRGERLGKTLTGYRSEFFRPGWSNGMVVYKWTPVKGAERLITDRISDITVSMKASDYLQLPERIDSTVSVNLSERAMTAYKKMEKDSLLRLDEETITALDAAAVMNKLLQLANGFVYDAEHAGHEIHHAKTDALDEIIEQADGPVLVYYSFAEDRERLLKHYGDRARCLKTEADLDDWNAGKVSILLAHPASAGYGLNLQDGGHIIVWYGLTWSLEQYQQANARLHRQGQTKPVLIYHLITSGTVDGQVLARLAAKDTTQSALLDVLKDRRRLNDKGFDVAKWYNEIKPGERDVVDH